MTSYPSKMLSVLVGAIEAIPTKVVSFVEATIDLFPGQAEEVVEAAVSSSQNRRAIEIVEAAQAKGMSEEVAIKAAVAGGAKEEDLKLAGQ